MLLPEMASKNEGTIGWRYLPLYAVALLSLLGTPQCQASEGELTTIQSTTTTTLSLTQTITVQATTPTSVQSEKMQNGDIYILQGCYGRDGTNNIGTILGSNFTAPDTSTRDGMSLSMCLFLCRLPASSGVKARDEQSLPLYIGLSDGKACYCGATLDSTAKEVQAKNCTLPCTGNNTIACGGHGFMLIYKLSNKSESAKKLGDGPYDNGAGSKGKPGVTAGIALGSIAGFGVLLLLIFYGAKTYKKRRQRQASGSDEQDAIAGGGEHADDDTVPTSNTASRENANRVDLRRFDPIVIDFAPIDGGRRASNTGRPKEIIAASTGADWRTGSPQTPRATGDGAPKLPANVPGNEAWDDIPDTPTILVQHPESVAQNSGLGERAWHRRRLSTPLPPAGYDGGSSSTGGGGPRGGWEPPSQGTGGRGMNRSEGSWDSLVPAPLTLPSLNRDTDSTSVPSEDGGPPSSKLTMWTVQSDPSLSDSLLGENVGKSAKTGKTE
ncbi:hypothetical protein N8I77_010306 [Diaporthe amygdali]|uniref:WSC domain-containing protein n=1 Tax=Phomopsis amygdali TaxID=1214568 RepID=A0AAD9S6Q8_PHOAM|nr:hypothetical protein N8I77_010306 [Diaporthe amygdali]